MLLATGLALALLAGPAAAQDPSPSITVAIENLNAEGGELQSDGSAEFPFSVTVTADNMVCQSATIPIALSVDTMGLPGYATVNLTPETLEFSVPQGVYASSVPVSGAYSGTLEASFAVAAGNVTANATLPLTVKAAFGGGNIEGCRAEGSFPAVEATAATNLSFVSTYVPPPPPPPAEDKSFLPGPGALVGTLAAFAAAGLRKRR